MKRRGFSLIEMLFVLAIIAVVFSMLFLTMKSLSLTADIAKQNNKYATISQIYNNLNHLENAIVVHNDFSNNQFQYQLPLLDSNDKIKIPLEAGKWFLIKCDNGQLLKVDMITNKSITLSPKDVVIQSSTFDFDNYHKQLRVTMDILLPNEVKNSTRISMTIDMLNVLNQI